MLYAFIKMDVTLIELKVLTTNFFSDKKEALAAFDTEKIRLENSDAFPAVLLSVAEIQDITKFQVKFEIESAYHEPVVKIKGGKTITKATIKFD